MTSTGTKFIVGLFLIIGTLMAVFLVIWVGMSGHLAQGKKFCIYFNESVQGLDKDSQVKYRGVSIGRVEKIQVALDGELIEVIIEIDENLAPRGKLIAQLKSVGITGIMFIELDQLPADFAEAPLALSFSSPYPVIPSRPSDIEKIFRDVERVFAKINSIDFEGISTALKADLDAVHRVLSDADMAGVSRRFTSALDRLNTILEPARWTEVLDNVNRVGENLNVQVDKAGKLFEHVDEVAGTVEKILLENRETLRLAMENLQKTTGESSALVSQTDARVADLYRHLLVSSQNLERATESLQRLLDALAQDPAQLIFGEEPKPRVVK